MKITKGKAFLFGYFGALIIFGVTAWRTPEHIVGVVDGVLAAVVGLVLSFSGSSVADNALKGKFYRAELDKKE